MQTVKKILMKKIGTCHDLLQAQMMIIVFLLRT